MSPAQIKKQAIQKYRPETVVSALAVTARREDLAYLRGVFGDIRWTLYEALSLSEGLAVLKRRRVDLVVTDRDLPDGCWRVLLDALKSLATPPALIVTSRLADEYLWAEVLNEGGYDVLAQPFEREEIIRVISAATRRTNNESAQRRPVFLSAGA